MKIYRRYHAGNYNLKEAMERIGLMSANALFQLERKYPEAFVVIKRRSRDNRHSRIGVQYDKALLDTFAKRQEYLKQEQP